MEGGQIHLNLMALLLAELIHLNQQSLLSYFLHNGGWPDSPSFMAMLLTELIHLNQQGLLSYFLHNGGWPDSPSFMAMLLTELIHLNQQRLLSYFLHNGGWPDSPSFMAMLFHLSRQSALSPLAHLSYTFLPPASSIIFCASFLL